MIFGKINYTELIVRIQCIGDLLNKRNFVSLEINFILINLHYLIFILKRQEI